MDKLGPLIRPESPLDPMSFRNLNIDDYRIAIMTGVNGSGKTTTVKAILETSKGTSLIRRKTTKHLRESDYIYDAVSQKGFLAMLACGEFIEASLYDPGYYGTSTTSTQAGIVESTTGIIACEMDPKAALVYKKRLESIGMVGTHLYFLDPYSDSLNEEDKLTYMKKRVRLTRSDSSDEQGRLIKAATYNYHSPDFDIRINTSHHSPSEVAKLILDDIAS